jgi:hypothetical protein
MTTVSAVHVRLLGSRISGRSDDHFQYVRTGLGSAARSMLSGLSKWRLADLDSSPIWIGAFKADDFRPKVIPSGALCDFAVISLL